LGAQMNRWIMAAKGRSDEPLNSDRA
jgi:hypothetical protein